MVRFFAGMLVGAVLALPLGAVAASVMGGAGPLKGWVVTFDGEDVCTDPYVWPSAKEIECED